MNRGYGAEPSVVSFGVRKSLSVAVRAERTLENTAGSVSDLQRTARQFSEMKRTLQVSQQELRAARKQVSRLTAANARLRRELLQRAHREASFESLAYFDELTKLPNRRVLLDRMGQVIARSAGQSRKMALLWLDLDGSKSVNDWLGHAAGDDLLTQMAERLAGSIRASDTACRYGGDEFAVMVADVGDANAVEAIAAKICSRLCAPYVIDGFEIYITVSFGTAIFPEDGQRVDDLMKKAYASMYGRKAAHREVSIYPRVPGYRAGRGSVQAHAAEMRR
jgi:diguanylate cyclase